MVIPEEGDSSCLSKLFCLMANVKTHTLLRVNQGLNTTLGKECPGKETHWLYDGGLSRCFISMENSICLSYSTQGP